MSDADFGFTPAKLIEPPVGTPEAVENLRRMIQMLLDKVRDLEAEVQRLQYRRLPTIPAPLPALPQPHPWADPKRWTVAGTAHDPSDWRTWMQN